MSAAFDADVWLGGEHEDPELPGQAVQLRPKIVAIMATGFADGIWDKDDVTKLDGTGFNEKAEKDWLAFYADSARALKEAALESHKRRLIEWLEVQYPSKDDGTAGKDGKGKPEPVSDAETTGGRAPKPTLLPFAISSTFAPTKELLMLACAKPNRDPTDPDPDLDLELGAEPKRSTHSLRRGSDTVARRDMEATEASASDIDLFYGWHEKVLTKEMQVHYASMSIKERMKKARITSLL